MAKPPVWHKLRLDALSRPSTRRYRDAINKLIAARESENDELILAIRSLIAVTEFFEADTILLNSGLTWPLWRLASVLNDVIAGAQPPLLFERSRRRGRPTIPSLGDVQATLAALAAGLIERGERREDAGKFIAKEAARAGVTHLDGKPIGWQQILRWRDEMGATASEKTTRKYRLALQNVRAFRDLPGYVPHAMQALRQVGK